MWGNPAALRSYLTSLWVELWWTVNEELLVTAFTHKSYAADFPELLPHNERLEFLGDSVLGCAIAEMLYQDFPRVAESTLTLSKIYLVKEATLAKAARAIELGEHIRLGHGEEKAWGADKDAILADGFEALIGFLYLDQWWECVVAFLQRHLYPFIQDLKHKASKSAKSRIQEYVQKQHQEIPVYEEKLLPGEETELYESTIHILGKKVATGTGPSKKKAQEAAAKNALQKLEI